MYDYKWPVIDQNTSIEKIKKIHRDIWQYVVENSCKPQVPYANGCVLCQYAWEKACFGERTHILCDYCLAKWPDGLHCGLPGSLYNEWVNSRIYEYDTAKTFAEQIRDIPFKFDKEEV